MIIFYKYKMILCALDEFTIFQYKKMIHTYETLTCSVISLFEEDVDEYGGCLEIKHVIKFFYTFVLVKYFINVIRVLFG